MREDDFLVVLILPDGTRKSMARTNGVPRVEIKDPKAGHVDAIVKLAHEDMQNQHAARHHRVSVDDQVEARC